MFKATKNEQKILTDNSFFLLGKKNEQGILSLSRLQICTWDISNKKTCLELGIEFMPKTLKQGGNYTIYLCSPWISKKCDITSLHEKFSDTNNIQFIFNETVASTSNIEGDQRNGSVFSFKDQEKKIAALPVEIQIEEGYLVLSFNNKADDNANPYIRILIKTDKKTLALQKTGISKTISIYDFKINERRNLPDSVLDIINKKNLSLCKIEKTLFLQVVPNSYEICFIDTEKLINIRNLETTFFKKYLPELNCDDGQYIITFCKDKDKSNYSFFNVFSEETIGTPQILLAVGLNVLCSLLFAIASFRMQLNDETKWYEQMPLEFYIAFFCFFISILYIFLRKKKILSV